MDAMFSPRTAAPVTRARQHSLGDLLHRSAARYPDKLAVVAGDRRPPKNPSGKILKRELRQQHANLAAQP